MTTDKMAANLLREAIKDPTNEAKLAAAKQHPDLQKVLTDMTQDDMSTLNRIAKADGQVKCVDTLV